MTDERVDPTGVPGVGRSGGTGDPPVLTGEDVAVLDRNAAALGVPQRQLMESSGNAVARAVRERTAPGDAVTVVAGRGNNGGDAFVAARFLADRAVTVLLLGRPESIRTEIARENWVALERSAIDARTVTDSRDLDLSAGHDGEDPTLVVDAMLGTGITGALREPERTAAAVINESPATVLAVDVPSGLDADTGERADGAVDADHVVTFHGTKPGLAPEAVTVADIGIPAAAETFVGPGDLHRLDRPADAHKGAFGRVTVIGGGPYTGAPALAARAALRAGADLAYVATPESVAREVQGYSPDLIVEGLPGDHLAPGHVEGILDVVADRDVVLIGPGLGDDPETADAVAALLERYDGRAVVDADALVAVPDVHTAATLVCTPHQGELREMGGPAADDWRERADAVETFAAELDQTLLVKGRYDVISDGERTRVNRTGNPGMTVGGTGDVLAGVTAAMLAVQSPVDAAAIAAYANGAAGDALVEDSGYGLLASDLPDALPEVIWSGRG